MAVTCFFTVCSSPLLKLDLLFISFHISDIFQGSYATDIKNVSNNKNARF